MPGWSSGAGTRSMAGGGDPCRDTPRTPHSSHHGNPSIHRSSLDELRALWPWGSSRHFPKTLLPFLVSPEAIWRRRRGGQGVRSIFRPCCPCSQTWQSLYALQLQHWQAQPSLLSCFLPPLPVQPQASPAAPHWPGPLPSWPHWGGPISR